MRAVAVAVVFAAALYGQAGEKRIYVTVVDAAGVAVSGLSAEDIAVREDGVDREVTGLKPASEPLSVALLVDTTAGTERYVVGIRGGLIAFARDVISANPKNEVAVFDFGGAAQKVRDFTSDAAALEKQLRTVYARSDAGSVMLEAVYAASEALARRPSPRRAIVVFQVEPGVELTERQPQQINASLMKSHAQLWTVSLQRGEVPSGDGRDALLTNLVRNAGGVRERILSDSAIERYMRLYAAALASQYEVTYRRPSGSAKVLQTGIRRDGLKIIAGLFAPQ